MSLVAIAAVVLMAFAGTASATTVTAPAGTTFTGELKAEAEGHVVLDNPIAEIQCASTLVGKVEQHGAGVTVKGNLSTLTFTGCTNSWHVTVVSAGSLEIHAIGEGPNGTLTSSGATVEATRFGITCRYATSNSDVGAITAGQHATIETRYAMSYHSGSGLCGTGATAWTGSYKVTSPTNLSVEGQGANH